MSLLWQDLNDVNSGSYTELGGRKEALWYFRYTCLSLRGEGQWLSPQGLSATTLHLLPISSNGSTCSWKKNAGQLVYLIGEHDQLVLKTNLSYDPRMATVAAGFTSILDKGRQKLTRCLGNVSSSRMVLPLHCLASCPRVLGWLLPCEFQKISSEFLWFNYHFFHNKMSSSQSGQVILMTEIRSFFLRSFGKVWPPAEWFLVHFLLCVLYLISV